MSSSARNAVVVIRNLPKSSGEAPGLRRTRTVFFVALRTGVVCPFHLLDGFEDAVLFLKIPPALSSVSEALAHHRARLHAVEDVEQVVRVAAHQRAGKRDQSLRGASEDAEAVALRRVAGQLVQFVGNGEVEPATPYSGRYIRLAPYAESGSGPPATARRIASSRCGVRPASPQTFSLSRKSRA